ncbi:MAG: polyprenyl synthetase family protein [Desulfobacterales bacterium]|nr:polyprenyl synthetase family protein [Desulfobacterales bacterium]
MIDGAETRRGKPSANNVWGNAATVLVGDFLYSRSFTLMTHDGDLNIIKLISETTNTMAEGEVFQLLKRGDVAITEEDYFTLIEKKTAVLIAAACAVGALMAGAPPDRVEALRQFGYRMGQSFQLTDDTLDYVAAEKEFGKALGMDIKEGKITLPLIRTLAQCPAEEKEDHPGHRGKEAGNRSGHPDGLWPHREIRRHPVRPGPGKEHHRGRQGPAGPLRERRSQVVASGHGRLHRRADPLKPLSLQAPSLLEGRGSG